MLTSIGQADAYEHSFLEALEPALPYIAKYRIKVAVNAGAADTKKLHDVVRKLVADRGLELSVAWISGDEVLPQLLEALKSGESFENICTGEQLKDWKFEPIYAQAYLGGLGIAKAFEKGADIGSLVEDEGIALKLWSSIETLARRFTGGWWVRVRMEPKIRILKREPVQHSDAT